MAGYFVCFWPGKHPLRRVSGWVCAPALLGLGLMFFRILYLSATRTSILESTSSVIGNRFRWVEANLWKLPEGFQLTLLGLVLIGIFISRMAFGIASLPIAIPHAHGSQENLEARRKLQFLIFLLVGPLFLVGLLLSFVSIGIPLMILATPPAYIQSIWFSRLAPVLGPCLTRAAEPPADQFGTLAWPAHSQRESRCLGGRHRPAPGFPDHWAGCRTETI